jgi:hypothetical protein
MLRIDDATAAAALPTPEALGTEGYFTEGNPGGGVPATIVRASWLNRVQELLRGVVAGVGITPTKTGYGQLDQAVRRLAGGNVANVTATGALTADQAGVVTINAAGGAITLTLPAANAAGGAPLRFQLARTDSSANAVTIQRAGADTIEGATSITLAAGERLQLTSDGVSAWRAPAGRFTQSIGTSGWLRMPSGLIVQWGAMGSSADVPGTAILSIAGSFPITFPNNPAQVVGTLYDSSGGGATVTSVLATPTGATFAVEEFKPNVQNLTVRYIAIGW